MRDSENLAGIGTGYLTMWNNVALLTIGPRHSTAESNSAFDQIQSLKEVWQENLMDESRSQKIGEET